MINSFYTEVKIPVSLNKIDHNQSIMLIGSCFTDEIGEKFSQNGFLVKRNPFGILYNPLSISVCLDRVAKKSYLDKEDLIQVEDNYYAFSAHGDFRAKSEQQCLDMINQSIDEAHDFLKSCNVLILTLGSAWTYWYKPKKYLMGNCHKVDSRLIDRKLLSQQEISDCISKAVNYIHEQINPSLRVILTLSPIRHWREGWHDNMLSKSTLYLAIEDLVRNFNFKYFPSYEIVMDELRDYRFYTEDLLHVSPMAVNHIWDKFSGVYFSYLTSQACNEFKKLYLMQNHRPLNPDSDAYKKHLQKIEELKQELQSKTIKTL